MKRIPLRGKRGSGKFALVDDEDLEIVADHSWHVSSAGYCCAGITQGGRSQALLMHRLIMSPGHEQLVDHQNHNKLDNRKANLRLCTYRQNNSNSRSYNTASRYKGVRRNGQRWHARITANKTEHYLGTFATEREAAQAYNEAAESYFGEFAGLNDLEAA